MNTAQLEWARTRIRSAAITDGKFELDVQRETNMGNLLFIPGLTSPVAEIRSLLFGQGQQGIATIPSWSQSMIAANTFGSGVTDILDLSGRGNTASQATPSSRAAWFREPKSGARQLLLGTAMLNASPWSLSGATISAATDPNGGNTAWRLTEDTSTGYHRLTSSSVLANGTVISVYAKAGGRNILLISSLLASGNPNLRFATFNLLTGTVVATAADHSATITAIGDGWYRCSMVTTSGGSSSVNFATGVDGSNAANNQQTGDGSSGIVLWRPQQELGTSATTWQNAISTFDITEAGQRDCYGVRFDGVDDSAQTGNINLSNTPNATVFLAVRKRSDTSLAGLITHNAGSDPSLQMRGPNSNGSATFSAVYRGSLSTRTAFSSSFPAPSTCILTGIYRRTLPSVALLVNGVQVAESTDAIGGGNFSNAPVNIGSLSGGLNPAAMDCFGAILVEGAATPAIIARVSRLLSYVTPTVNL